MRFELADHDADQGILEGIQCLSACQHRLSSLCLRCGTYHEAELAPLVEKVAVDIDTVWLAQILGYERADTGEVFFFLVVRVLEVAKLGG